MRDIRKTWIVAVALAGLIAAGSLLSGCNSAVSGAGSIPAPNESKVSEDTTETSIFYSTGRSLLEERRVVDADDPYTQTLKELLLASPESNQDVAIVQPEAGFNSVTLKDGMLTIDWKKEVLDFEAEDREKRLAFASILATFGRFDAVEQIRFTVEGKDKGEIGGKSIEDFWGAVSLKAQPFKPLFIKRSPTDKGEIMEEAQQKLEASGTAQ